MNGVDPCTLQECPICKGQGQLEGDDGYYCCDDCEGTGEVADREYNQIIKRLKKYECTLQIRC